MSLCTTGKATKIPLIGSACVITGSLGWDRVSGRDSKMTDNNVIAVTAFRDVYAEELSILFPKVIMGF